MNSKLLLCLALVLSGIVFSASLANAQPGGGYTFTSLEARIIQARVVFRATLTNVQETVVHTNNDRGAYDFYNYAVALKIDEVLKGKLSHKSLAFTINHVAKWVELPKWAGERVSILWFLNGSEKTMGEDFHGDPSGQLLWLEPTRPGQDDLGANFHPSVYDTDMTLLSKPADILARARTFVRKRLDVTRFHKIFLPQFSVGDHYYYSFKSSLVVPVGPSLEKTAKHLIAAPEDFISTTNDPAMVPQWRCDLRSEGVSALQYFKSSKNTKLLKSLLVASDCWTIKDWSTEYRDMNVTNKIYSVRSKAYEVLKGWGVDVPKPVTEEKVLPKDKP